MAPDLDVTASWKVAPPLYYRAATGAFQGLFISADESELEQQVSEHRTNKKPAKKVGALKMLLRQFEATGNPPLQGAEVLPPKLIGDGNYHWYPLATPPPPPTTSMVR